MPSGRQINKGFKTFSSTMYTMFVAGSTDEFVARCHHCHGAGMCLPWT